MMDYIIKLFKILFLAETVLITPSFIDIEVEKSIFLEKNIEAITKEASIIIDVSEMIDIKNNDKFYEQKEIYKTFYPKSISAYIHNDELNLTIPLYYEKSISYGKNSVQLMLNNFEKMRTSIQFNRITIKTEVPLKNIKILWRNSSK